MPPLQYLITASRAPEEEVVLIVGVCVKKQEDPIPLRCDILDFDVFFLNYIGI